MNPIQKFPQPTSVTFFSEEIEKPQHGHCPLCVDSMVYPKEDIKTPAIIFLDMDGVMLADQSFPATAKKIELTLHHLFPQIKVITDYHWTIAKVKHLNPIALQNLNRLIDRIEASGQRALIVLSSSWRNDATLQQHREEIFAEQLFSKYLCGKTAPDNVAKRWTPEYKQGFRFSEGAKESFGLKLEDKSDAIEYWLRDHGFDLDATNYIVIDDDPQLGRFGEHFIRTDNLFREKNLEQAANVLKV